MPQCLWANTGAFSGSARTHRILVSHRPWVAGVRESRGLRGEQAMGRRRSSGCLTGVLGVGVLIVAVVALFDGGDQPVGPHAEPTAGTSPHRPATKSKSPRSSAAEPERPPGRFGFADVARAQQVVSDLPVKGRAALTGYSREAFGTAWLDTNDNSCDTRNDILRRDLRNKVVDDCVVLSGVLDDPYSGRTIVFTRGPVSSLDVQIDHVVALANAWQTGAAYWSPATRERFANDRRNLLAVDGPLNMQKGSGDAATWLPPKKSFRCTYVTIQVLTKHRYGLWVTAAEKAAMQRILASC